MVKKAEVMGRDTKSTGFDPIDLTSLFPLVFFVLTVPVARPSVLSVLLYLCLSYNDHN